MRLASRFLRSGLTAAIVVSCCLATSGCSNLRSFFQMSSDSPVPFFGFDLALPPKFSAVEVSTTAAEVASSDVGSTNWPRKVTSPQKGNDVSSLSQVRGNGEIPPLLVADAAFEPATPPAF